MANVRAWVLASSILSAFACGGRSDKGELGGASAGSANGGSAAGARTDASGGAGGDSTGGSGASGGDGGQGGIGPIGGAAGRAGAGTGAGGIGTGTGGGSGSGGAGATSGGGTGGGAADAGDGSDASDAGPPCLKALTGDVLDPEEIYLVGKLSEGSVPSSALAHWSCPNSGVIGFPTSFDSGVTQLNYVQLRPTDGRVIYPTGLQLREFRCDRCPYVSGGYPLDSETVANDPVIPAPCPSANTARFLVSPEGEMFFFCGDTKTWRNTDGTLIYEEFSNPLLHVGYGGFGLTESRLVDLRTGNSVEIAGLPTTRTTFAIRAVAPDAFLVVKTALVAGATYELFRVDTKTAAATLLGEYPPLPPEATSFRGRGALRNDGAYFQMAVTPGSIDVLLRRSIDGTTEVVYTEATRPRVMAGNYTLLTGP